MVRSHKEIERTDYGSTTRVYVNNTDETLRKSNVIDLIGFFLFLLFNPLSLMVWMVIIFAILQ